MSTINVNTLPTARPVSTGASSEESPVTPDRARAEIDKTVQSVEQVNSRILNQRTRSAEKMQSLQESLDEAIRTLNDKMAISPKNLRFSVDEVSNRYLVVVTDESNGDVIRQVPAEAVLRVAHNIEALKGVLFDKVL